LLEAIYFMKTNHLFVLLLLICSAQLLAGPVAYSTSSISSNDNKVYAGLKWTLNEGIKPQAVIGFRHTNIGSDGHTDGGDISLSAKFIDGFQLDKTRLKYINGNNDVQGELGGGYDFTKGLFLGGSANGPYINLGVDYLIQAKDKSIDPYIMLNTLSRTKTKTIIIPIGVPC
jgi:hypothetical protein